MEVGTKELKKGNKKEAAELFEKSYKLYSLFWALNLTNNPKIKENKKENSSTFAKFNDLVQKALDCCRE
jgi:hypothetical protein